MPSYWKSPAPSSNPPTPPPPSRDARAALRASILPASLESVTGLPSYAQALEEETLRPVRAEDFYDLTKPPAAEELTTAQKKTLFAAAFFEERVTLEELAPYRIRVAYRFVREHLRLRGTHLEQPLGQLGPSVDCKDPWVALRTSAPRHLNTSAAAQGALPLLDEADKLSPGGLSLLPPMPPEHIPAHVYRPGNTDHDPRLHLFVDLFKTTTTYLGIKEGTKTDPRLGKYGLLGLTNPLTIRLLFPTRLQLVQYERILMQETLDLLTKQGRREAEAVLFAKYGFFDDEIMLLFKLATQRARQTVRADAEEDKALMILRLEDLLKRARALDSYRTELMVLKTMAIVQGLARVEPNDFHTAIENAFKKLESEPRAQLPQLPLDD